MEDIQQALAKAQQERENLQEDLQRQARNYEENLLDEMKLGDEKIDTLDKMTNNLQGQLATSAERIKKLEENSQVMFRIIEKLTAAIEQPTGAETKFRTNGPRSEGVRTNQKGLEAMKERLAALTRQ